MSAIIKKNPLTHQELIDLAGNQLVRFPASFDEYWNMVDEVRI